MNLVPSFTVCATPICVFAESKSLPLYVLNTGAHQVHIKVTLAWTVTRVLVYLRRSLSSIVHHYHAWKPCHWSGIYSKLVGPYWLSHSPCGVITVGLLLLARVLKQDDYLLPLLLLLLPSPPSPFLLHLFYYFTSQSIILKPGSKYTKIAMITFHCKSEM